MLRAATVLIAFGTLLAAGAPAGAEEWPVDSWTQIDVIVKDGVYTILVRRIVGDLQITISPNSQDTEVDASDWRRQPGAALDMAADADSITENMIRRLFEQGDTVDWTTKSPPQCPCDEDDFLCKHKICSPMKFRAIYPCLYDDSSPLCQLLRFKPDLPEFSVVDPIRPSPFDRYHDLVNLGRSMPDVVVTGQLRQ